MSAKILKVTAFSIMLLVFPIVLAYSAGPDTNPGKIGLRTAPEGIAAVRIQAPDPIVTTNAASSVTRTMVTLNGTVDDNGKDTAVTFEYGLTIAYGSGGPATPATVTAGSGATAVSAGFGGLTPNTVYHFRVVGINGDGTGTGADQTFTTLPTVSTTAASSITKTTAQSGGTIDADGGAAISAGGVCWNTAGTPTIGNSHTTDVAATGAYSSDITLLTANTTYHVRAYATNAGGTSYGADLEFTTLANVTTTAVSSITKTTAQSGGTIDADGGAAISAGGVCWNTAGTPTIGNSHTTDVAATGAYTSDITLLTANTKYHVRAYATNAGGTSYGAEVDFTTLANVTTTAVSAITATTASSGGTVDVDGNEAITARGVCWNTTGAPNTTDGNAVDGAPGTGAFTSSIPGLTANTKYHVRAYATNAGGTSYGAEVDFTTLANVTTTAVSLITKTTAQSGGNIAAGGGEAISARGVCWGTNLNPTTADSTTSDAPPIAGALGGQNGGVPTGAFTSAITGLTANTKYHVRAYATNAGGASYGADVVFTTLANVTTTAVTAITGTTAQSGGMISVDGGEAVTARGVCWSTNLNPTLADSKTTDGAGTGAYTSNITGLSANTNYHVRAYATNAGGTSYGADVPFSTQGPPSVTTQAVTAITTTTATGNATITIFGATTPTQYGVVWNTAGNPTIADNRTQQGVPGGTGPFTSPMTGLAPGTTYFVKGYATNGSGTGYGDEVSFMTVPTYTISGTATASGRAIPWVDVTFSHDGHVESADAAGRYAYVVPRGTTTTVTPTHRDYSAWTPSNRVITNIQADQPGQDFVGTPRMCRITGRVTDGTNPVSGVTIAFSFAGHTETTAADGTYSYLMPPYSSTTITPSKTGWTSWSPAIRELTNINTDQPGQDFQGRNLSAPRIALVKGQTEIPKGGTYDYGTQLVNADSQAVFTINNTGGSDLTLQTNLVISGANADQFSVIQAPTSSVAPNQSTTFKIEFKPTSVGQKTASVSLVNNDPANNPFALNLQGKGKTSLAFRYSGSWTTADHGGEIWYLGDFNGDGKTDIFRYGGASGADMFLSNGAQFVSSGSWTPAGHGTDGWYVGDYNGDGKTDILRYGPGASGADVFLSNGRAFVYAGSWTPAGHGTDGWYVGDYNGDGKSDLLRVMPGSTDVFLSTGANFLYAGSWTTAVPGTDGWYIGDFDGDGKSDLLRVGAGSTEAFLSTGTSFVSAGSWTTADPGADGWYVGDFNGDGKTDIFRYGGASGADVFLSEGSEFDYSGSWTPAGHGPENWYVGNFDGTGGDDIFRFLTGVSGADVFLSNSALPASVSESNPDLLALDGALTPVVYRELSYAEETRLLAPYIAGILRGEDVSIFEIKKAYEEALGRTVRKAAVNQLLSRHDLWRLIDRFGILIKTRR